MTDHFLSRRAVLGAVGGAVALTALAGPADADASMIFRSFGDVPERTPPPAPAAVQEQAAHTPPLVVLALTLGLGLAVGAAGGYLVGHRSGERAAQRALGGETGMSAPYDDTASTPTGPAGTDG